MLEQHSCNRTVPGRGEVEEEAGRGREMDEERGEGTVEMQWVGLRPP